LVFNPSTNTMDAFTTATTDYTTSYWYDLCVNLAVMRVNGPYVVNWDILWPSTTPSSCVSGAVELEDSASVAATPGRQYFAEGLVELYVFYTYSDIVYDCGEYCDGYWYDAEGYSLLSTTPDPTNADWPSIEYSYPYEDEPEPVYDQALAMTGSGATAWAPPVIYYVNGVAPPSEAQFPAGATTTVTISGAGFGYGPSLTISGTGVTGYTNPCASNPSSSCDSTIVATVTIDASTPANSQETITVTAGGQNPSGFLPVDTGPDPNQQATAQATTTAFSPPVPQIMFNGTNVANNGAPSCPGNVACVFVGQQIGLTVVVPNLPSGVSVQSYTWSQPAGTVVGGYTSSKLSGKKQPFPVTKTGSCQTLSESCLMFYWVDQAPSTTITLSYTLSNGPGNSATVTLNVGGPTNISIAVVPTPLNRAAIQIGQSNIVGQGLVMAFGNSALGGQQPGITLNASAVLPSGNQGQYSWIQVLTTYNWHFVNAQGRWVCPLDASPEGDGGITLGATFEDNPFVPATLDLGETEALFKAMAYLMWTPDAASGCSGTACTIPVPLALLNWSWTADAINTRPSQADGSGWIKTGCENCASDAIAQPTAAHPEWTSNTSEGCQPAPIR
jgi:hypothetical protein